MHAKSGRVDKLATVSSPQELDACKERINPTITSNAPGLYRVIRRNGEITCFDQNKIAVAITKAFLAEDTEQSNESHEIIAELVDCVVNTLTRRKPDGGTFHIEEIQDQVELCLMRQGYLKIARAYMLYRETRAKARAATRLKQTGFPGSEVAQANGSYTSLNIKRLRKIVAEACTDLEDINPSIIAES